MLFLTFFSFWYTIKRIIWNISLRITCIPAEREFPVSRGNMRKGTYMRDKPGLEKEKAIVSSLCEELRRDSAIARRILNGIR